MKARWIRNFATFGLAFAVAACGPTETADVASPATLDDAGTTPAPTPVAAAPVPAAFADVSIATVDEIAAFLDENAGNVLVINFWATWCAPCVHEMPELAAFYAAYKDRGIAFLSLSSDAIEDYETKLVPFVRERSLPFHVYAIANVDPDELDKLLNVGMDFALPTTFVFDRERNLAQKWMRNITQADLERAVAPLLDETVAP